MKKLLVIFFSIILLLILVTVGGYNFFTSEYGVKNYIIPFVSDKTGSRISVKKINISLFNSYMELGNLAFVSDKLKIESESFKVKTNIYEILFDKKIEIKSLQLKNSNVFIDITQDKKSDNDSEFSNKNSEYEKENNPSKQDTPKQIVGREKLQLPNITLNNIKFNNVNITVKNGPTVTKISKLMFDIPKLEPNLNSNINLRSELSIDDGKNILSGDLNSKTIVMLNKKFLPLYIDSESAVMLDDSEMPLNIKLETAKNGNFTLNSNINNIVLKPFAEAFIPGVYQTLQGKINSVIVNASGSSINNLINGKNININLAVNGTNVLLKKKFNINNENIDLMINLDSIKSGDFIPEKLNISDFNAEYFMDGQLLEVDHFDFKLQKESSNSIKALFKLLFKAEKNKNILSGELDGNTFVSGNIQGGNPDNAVVDAKLTIDKNLMPIKINYEKGVNNEFIKINVQNIEFDPFIKFAEKNMNITGSIANLKISLEGNSSSAFKNFNNTGTKFDTIIVANNSKFEDINKLYSTIKNITLQFNLKDLINKKYYLDKLHIINPKVIYNKVNTIVKNRQGTAKSVPQVTGVQKHLVAKKHQSTTQANTTKATSGTPKKQKYYFDIKDLLVSNGALEINTEKNLSIKSMNVLSEEIKTNKNSNIQLTLEYKLNSKISGNFNSKNSVIINSYLFPEKIDSSVKLFNNDNVSKNKISFTGKPDNKTGDIAYNADININNLLLDPFLNTFAPEPYNKSKVYVNSFTINTDGNNIKKSQAGNIEAEGKLSKISVPVNVGDENLIEAIFFPIRTIANFSSNTALKFVSGNVANALVKIDNTFNVKKRMDFKSSNIKISSKAGLIDIQNFDCIGNVNNPVSEIKVAGSANLTSKALHLETDTRFAGLDIPLEINGTIENPQTDNSKLAAQFLQNNTDTFIKTGTDMSKTINKTIKNIKTKNFGELLQNVENNDNKSNDSGGNDLSNLLDNFSQQLNSGGQKNTNTVKGGKTTQKASSSVDQVMNLLQGASNSQQNKVQGNGKAIDSKPNSGVDDQIKNLLNF